MEKKTVNQIRVIEQEIKRRFNKKNGAFAWDEASDDERAEYYNKSYANVCKKLGVPVE